MAQDWTDLINGLPLPIRLIMGAAESTSRLERAERLAQTSAAKGSNGVKLVAGPDGRFFLAFSAPELVLATLKDAQNDSQLASASA